jgi:catalase
VKLGGRKTAWPYWVRQWGVVAVIVAAVLRLAFGNDDSEFVRIALAVVAVYFTAGVVFRGFYGPIVRRALQISGTVVALVAIEFGSDWAGEIPLAVAIGVLFVVRQIGSVSPRYIGVARPDAALERNSPVEGTSDDAAVLVDALDRLFGSTRAGGPRQGLRAVHSHGSIVRGVFCPKETEGFSGIPLFVPGRSLPVVARFSNFDGSLTRDDTKRFVHGLAIRIDARNTEVGNGDSAEPGFDMVLMDAKRFPVSNRDDVVEVLDRFRNKIRLLAMIPMARSTIMAMFGLFKLRRARSYASQKYYGVNTFIWNGEPVRFLLIPAKRSSPVDLKPAKRSSSVDRGDPKTRLDRDLRNRLRPGKIVYEFRVVRGRGLPQRRLDSAMLAWSRFMPHWTVGWFMFDQYIGSGQAERIAFDPHRLPRGIEPSRDEILMARRAAYAESYLRRCPVDTRR